MRYTVKKVNTILGVMFEIVDGNEGVSLYKRYTFEDEAERACRRLNNADIN